jgi:hypothetical protein
MLAASKAALVLIDDVLEASLRGGGGKVERGLQGRGRAFRGKPDNVYRRRERRCSLRARSGR